MNKNYQNYLYIFVSALTIGAGGYLYSTNVLAAADNPIAQVAKTNSQIDTPTTIKQVALDTPNAQTNAKNQVQQMASPNVLTAQTATAKSGQVEDVKYSIDNGVLTLNGGTLKLHHAMSYPWLNDNTITNIRITGALKLEGRASEDFFYNMPNLKSIIGIDNLDTSKATDMDHMFAENKNLTNLDLSNFDTSNVKNMASMFQYTQRLSSLDVSKFDTAKVTDMSSMFSGTQALTSLDLSSFNTSNVTDMSDMFRDNYRLARLDLSSFDTAKVTDMSYMFWYNYDLASLNLSNFNTANVTTMNRMFYHAWGLTSLNVSSFNTANVNDMTSMFGENIKLVRLDLSNFDTSNVLYMSNMFNNDDSLTNLDLSSFDTTKVQKMDDMFLGNKQLWTLKLGPQAFTNGFDKTSLPKHSSLFNIPGSNPVRYANGPGWQAVDTKSGGTVQAPKGTIYDGLLTNRPAETETYVWEQKPAADQYTLEVNKTQELYEGQSWNPSSAITAATKNGESNKSSVTITDQDDKPVTQETVAALKSGSYPLTYKNGDQTGTLNLTITADSTSLKTTDIDLYLNKAFTDVDLREKIEAKDSDGTSLNYQYNIKDVTGKLVAVNDVSAKVGQYTVEITTDKPKNGKDSLKGSLTIKVTDSSTLNLKYATKTITTNQAWQPEEAFDNATDVGGQTLAFKDITVNATDSSGKPVNDLNNLYKNPGTYTVHYTNGSATKELKLTVQTPSNPTKPTTPSNPNNPSRPSTPVTPNTPSHSSSVSSSTSSVGSNASSNTPASASPSNTSNNANLPRYAAAKETVVYSIKKIGLYKTTDFTKNTRRSWYAKKPRINRPMFVVTGYKRAANGALRYQVRDVNHTSRTDGQKGYITASQKYVRPVYYATKHSTITVINPRGVNAYHQANLTGKVKNYRQGTVLRIKGIVKHNLTTRYILTNGDYITANRKLVNMGRHKQVKSVKTKLAINRYSNVNLTKKNQSIAKNRTLKVYGYDYSRKSNVTKHGALRYRVAGGYVTANTKYVQVIDRG
ncbi:BspA family leucine-rich repeat surface protein [Lentilactobacillus hilgardii]|nr:BspA family leucine-rich repeat surface protein [Lentilactobacillus hilgardii]MCV3739956.1 BspA family leucine-rich repeat surface protein [Lentilactobacillus hilgardii]